MRTGAPLGTLEDAGARARSHTVPPSLESHTRRRGLPPFKLPVRTQWHPAPRRSCPPYQGHCRGRRMARLPHGAAASRSSRCLAGARVLPSARGRRSSVRWRESRSIPTTRATDRVDWPRKSRQCLASKLRFGKFSASLPASAPGFQISDRSALSAVRDDPHHLLASKRAAVECAIVPDTATLVLVCPSRHASHDGSRLGLRVDHEHAVVPQRDPKHGLRRLVVESVLPLVLAKERPA